MEEAPILPIHSPTPSLKHDTYPPKAPTMPSAPPGGKARGVARLTVHIPSAFLRDANKVEGKSPPRWNTLEFKIYYVIAVVAVGFIVWIPVLLSQRERRPYLSFGNAPNL